jgi:hypothetical protein
MPQPGGSVHAAPSIEHVPPTSGQVVVQSAPVALQVLLRSQSGLVAKHAAPLAVQWPGCVGHSAGSEPAVWQMLLTRLQWPALVHGPVSRHVSAVSALQCPAIVGQMSPRWQVVRTLALQFPNSEQSPSTKQPGAPSREQIPGWVGQSPAAPVQALPRKLQVPELGQVAAVTQSAPLLLHFPGGHVVIWVHTGHSVPVHGQTSGGDHTVVQVAGSGGIQLGATGLQVWTWTLLHVWPVILTHVCVVTPSHVCVVTPSHVWVPTPAQVCATGATQV